MQRQKGHFFKWKVDRISQKFYLVPHNSLSIWSSHSS